MITTIKVVIISSPSATFVYVMRTLISTILAYWKYTSTIILATLYIQHPELIETELVLLTRKPQTPASYHSVLFPQNLSFLKL